MPNDHFVTKPMATIQWRRMACNPTHCEKLQMKSVLEELLEYRKKHVIAFLVVSILILLHPNGK